jgi:uncharacterized protein YdhG (YjbR/CyaY superfamily)
MMNKNIHSVDEYILLFPENVQVLLTQMRTIIKENAPKATESIAYHMPAYKLNGKVLVYFAAYKNHIGFYATPQSHEAFAKPLASYKQGKGSVQFPINDPLPLELIKEMVVFKVNLAS